MRPLKTKYTTFRALYGIGLTTASKLYTIVGVTNHGSNLQFFQRQRVIREIINHQSFGYNIRLRYLKCVIRLKNHKCYRGLRSAAGLPIRGQRTHTNAKTLRSIVKSGIYLDLERIKRYGMLDIKPTIKDPTRDKARRKRKKKRPSYLIQIYIRGNLFTKKIRKLKKKKKNSANAKRKVSNK